MARLPATQSIHRAELLVIALACETFQEFELHTDSSAAKSGFEQACSAQSPADFADNVHFDLILRIFKTKQPGHRVLKIKAHRDLLAP